MGDRANNGIAIGHHAVYGRVFSKFFDQSPHSRGTLERKVRVAMDWTLDLFFQRDIVLLRVFMKRLPSEMPMDAIPTQKGPTQD